MVGAESPGDFRFRSPVYVGPSRRRRQRQWRNSRISYDVFIDFTLLSQFDRVRVRVQPGDVMSSSNRGQRDRNREPRYYRDSPEDRRSSSGRSSSRAPYNPREADYPRKQVRDGARSERRESKWTYVCSRRGVLLICAVLTNSLVLICVVAAQMVTSGMSSRGGMTGFDINSDFNLQGTELQQMRDLDVQYSQMRAPGVYGGIPFSLTMGIISLLFVVSANKPPHRMPQKLLIGALAFQAVGAVAYVVAVGLYLHFIIGVNSTDVCTLRARLYARNGLTWMNCDVSGADAAVALFGIITAILYIAGAVLTFQIIRKVKNYLQERERHRAERQLDRVQPQDRARPQKSPPRAEAVFV
ncbi:hypothetical protein Q5P01_015492 [Channa striata]|uniref:MARVEL domain-containing protein n=1 Tax=Channa striata TaxID=64152 RepID=A0AA88MCE5_CHASR|nr:hypothetical protein Q5P01_015492 [Channa striata]